jgi:predicted MFS family arabinose efflux permease
MYLFLSLYLQQVAGFSPLRAGLAFLPAGLATLAGALAAPRLVAVRGSKHQLLIGPAISASGLIWITGLSRATATGVTSSARWCCSVSASEPHSGR